MLMWLCELPFHLLKGGGHPRGGGWRGHPQPKGCLRGQPRGGLRGHPKLWRWPHEPPFVLGWLCEKPLGQGLPHEPPPLLGLAVRAPLPLGSVARASFSAGSGARAIPSIGGGHASHHHCGGGRHPLQGWRGSSAISGHMFLFWIFGTFIIK